MYGRALIAYPTRFQSSVRVTGSALADVVRRTIVRRSFATCMPRVTTIPTFSADRAPSKVWVTTPAPSSTT